MVCKTWVILALSLLLVVPQLSALSGWIPKWVWRGSKNWGSSLTHSNTHSLTQVGVEREQDLGMGRAGLRGHDRRDEDLLPGDALPS